MKQKQHGFFYGYIIVVACLLVQGIGVGSHVAYGVFFKPLVSEFGWSRATVSGASSMAFLLMGFLGILVGNLNDRFGPRMIMTISALFFGCGYLLLGQIDEVWQLYLAYGLVGGIGLSAVDVIPLTTTARWFLSRRGIMTGFVKVGTGAGQMMMPFLAGLCITNLGWRTASAIIGIIAVVFLMGAAQMLRRDPGQMGQFPDGHVKTSVAEAFRPDGGLTLQQAIRNRQFWMLCIITLLAVSCMMTILVHIVAHATDIGIDTLKAAGILSTIGGVSMTGRMCRHRHRPDRHQAVSYHMPGPPDHQLSLAEHSQGTVDALPVCSDLRHCPRRDFYGDVAHCGRTVRHPFPWCLFRHRGLQRDGGRVHRSCAGRSCLRCNEQLPSDFHDPDRTGFCQPPSHPAPETGDPEQ